MKTIRLAFRRLKVFRGSFEGTPGNFIFTRLVVSIAVVFLCFRSCDGPDVAYWINQKIQLFMNALQLSSKVTLNVCILRIECFFKGLFGLSQSLHFNLVCFYARVQIVQFFLNDSKKDT
jgi:hypothetical protein